MSTIRVMVSKDIEVPKNYEVVPYNPTTKIENGWMFYFATRNLWERTGSEGMLMECASDSGRLVYIRPIVKKIKIDDIPTGTYFFWSKYPNKLYLKHYMGVVGLDTFTSWNQDEGDQIVEGYTPVEFTYQTTKIS